MIKKAAFLLLICAVSLGAYAGQSENEDKKEAKIQWVSIEEAQNLGKKNPKKVFVDVYTNWCGWCKRMDAVTFSDPDVVDYVNDHYYAVKLNAESDKKVTFNGTVLSEAELARSFRVSGYPTIVFIDESFQYVTPMPGFRQAEEFRNILKQFNGEGQANQK